MDNRAQALAILQQAREALSQRLIERVVEAGVEIIDDANGASYSSEIETIFDQLGSRLGNVNAMISQLQSADDEPIDDIRGAAPSEPSADNLLGRPFVQTDTAMPAAPAVLAVDFAAGGESPAEATRFPISFDFFSRQIQASDLDAAGRCLAELFQIDLARAKRCAATFHERLRTAPELLTKAMKLRHELESNSVNSSLILLWECFGLQGVESLGVVQVLRARLTET